MYGTARASNAGGRMPVAIPRRIKTTAALVVALGVSLGLAVGARAAEPPPHDGAAHAFINVSVLSMDAPGAVPGRTVLVDGNKITEVGPASAVTVPEGAIVIDGTGRFLMPGLADMHAHIGMDYQPDQSGQRGELLLYLATGVTTLRNAVGSVELLHLADEIADGAVLGPRLEVASPLLEGEDAVWGFSTRVLTADEGRAAVRQFAAEGFESLKIYHTLSRPTYKAIVEEAHGLGVPFFGHVPFDVGVEEVLADGMASIEHFRGYDIDGLPREALEDQGGRSPERFASWLHMSDERMAELVEATVAAGTWNCPTFVVNSMLIDAARLEEYADHPMAEYMPDDLIRRFRESGLEALFSPDTRAMLAKVRPRMLTFLERLHAAGAPVMTGTDTFPSLVPGFTLIDEIGAFVEAGLSRYEALQAATTAPARFLGDADRRGKVSPGMEADLVLLGANPLEDIDHLWQVEGVMADGRWLARETLLALLQEVKTAQAPKQPSADAPDAP